MIARTPGATVRSIGGLGQFSAVSIRGSAPQQVAVFIDGVPLASNASGLVDLSAIPLDGIGRVEIYRGHVPAQFGGAAIGGAINLVTEAPTGRRRVQLAAGTGSFGARQSQTAFTTPLRTDLQLTGRVGYAGATGNFPFYDTGGTPSFTADDSTSRRTNNDYDRVLGQLRIDGRRGRVRFGVQELVLWKQSGIAGAANIQTTRSRLNTFSSRTIASVRRDGFSRPGTHTEWLFAISGFTQRFVDPLGEVGFGIDDEHTANVDTYISPRLRIPLWRGAFIEASADQRFEWIAVNERATLTPGVGAAATKVRTWVGTGLSLQQFLFDRRWLIAPIVRVDGLHSRADGLANTASSRQFDWGIAPRIGTRLRVFDWLQLRASGGRYFRPPTLLEQFGDRGYFVGSAELESERGTAIDGGFVVDHVADRVRAYLQVAGFATWTEDLIQWVVAGPVARPINVGSARTSGLELASSISGKRRAVELAANYTLLASENRSDDATARGQPLPGRPRHELFVQSSAGYEWSIGATQLEPRLRYTFEFISGTTLDPSGRLELPPRAIHGASFELHVARRVHAAVEVRNLLDVRTSSVTLPVGQRTRLPFPIADFIGFPLPGRTVFATVRVDIDWGHSPQKEHS